MEANDTPFTFSSAINGGGLNIFFLATGIICGQHHYTLGCCHRRLRLTLPIAIASILSVLINIAIAVVVVGVVVEDPSAGNTSILTVSVVVVMTIGVIVAVFVATILLVAVVNTIKFVVVVVDIDTIVDDVGIREAPPAGDAPGVGYGRSGIQRPVCHLSE